MLGGGRCGSFRFSCLVWPPIPDQAVFVGLSGAGEVRAIPIRIKLNSMSMSQHVLPTAAVPVRACAVGTAFRHQHVRLTVRSDEAHHCDNSTAQSMLYAVRASSVSARVISSRRPVAIVHVTRRSGNTRNAIRIRFPSRTGSQCEQGAASRWMPHAPPTPEPVAAAAGRSAGAG